MLDIDSIMKLEGRSGESLRSGDLKHIRRFLLESETLWAFEKQRNSGPGHCVYSCLDLIMVLLWMEVKKTTFEGVVADLTDHGGQHRLAALGMPVGKDRKRRCPVASTLCAFRKHVLPEFAAKLQDEIAEAYLMQRLERYCTCDSTPMEASRYSRRCDYNVHYEIRMDKLHMITVNGVPIMYRHTAGNKGDNPELLDMLEGMKAENPSLYAAFLTDGGYHSFDTYVKVFQKTGKVMSTNQGVNAAFHDEATWQKLLDKYNGMWRNRDFKPSKHVTPREILLYLISHGESSLVGRFLHNLDYLRGSATKAVHSLRRHMCETLHFEAKRWIRLDVRGVHAKSVASVVSFRFLAIQLLSLAFAPLDR